MLTRRKASREENIAGLITATTGFLLFFALTFISYNKFSPSILPTNKPQVKSALPPIHAQIIDAQALQKVIEKKENTPLKKNLPKEEIKPDTQENIAPQQITQETEKKQAIREAEKLAAEKVEAERIAQERAAHQATEIKKAQEKARQAAKKAEEARKAQEKAAQAAKKAEEARKAQEEAMRKLAQQKIAREKANQEAVKAAARQAAEKKAAAESTKEKAILEQMSLDKLAKEKIAQSSNTESIAAREAVKNAAKQIVKEEAQRKAVAEKAAKEKAIKEAAQRKEAAEKAKKEKLAKEAAQKKAAEKAAAKEKAAKKAQAAKERATKEAARNKALAAELLAHAEEAEHDEALEALDEYARGILKEKLDLAWEPIPNLSNNLTVDLFIQTNREGKVLKVAVDRSSGTPIFDNSAINAVLRADPLPLPNHPKAIEMLVNKGIIATFQYPK